MRRAPTKHSWIRYGVSWLGSSSSASLHLAAPLAPVASPPCPSQWPLRGSTAARVCNAHHCSPLLGSQPANMGLYFRPLNCSRGAKMTSDGHARTWFYDTPHVHEYAQEWRGWPDTPAAHQALHGDGQMSSRVANSSAERRPGNHCRCVRRGQVALGVETRYMCCCPSAVFEKLIAFSCPLRSGPTSRGTA